jgi:hypothetical protein
MSGKHYVFDENKSKQEAMSRAEVETAINDLTDSVTESISTISQRVAGLHTIQTLDFTFPSKGTTTNINKDSYGETFPAYTAHFTLDEPIDLSKVLRAHLIQTIPPRNYRQFYTFALFNGEEDFNYIFEKLYRRYNDNSSEYIELRPTEDGFDCICYYYSNETSGPATFGSPTINANFTLRLDCIV